MENREKNIIEWLHDNRVVAAAIACFTALIYYPTLWYGFIFDDLPTITNYIHIKEFNPLALFFSSTRWVPRLLDQVTYRFGQIEPFAYRIFNLALHVGCGVLLFWVMLSLVGRLQRFVWIRERALAVATLVCALFLLHPLQTQTATYIIQMRLEGLVTFFVLAVVMTFIKAIDAPANRTWYWYAASLALTVLAAGTKEIVVVLPFLVLLVDWFFVAQGDWSNFKTRLKMHLGYFGALFGVMAYFGIVRPHAIASLVGAAVHNNRGNILTGGFEQPITLFPFVISQFKVILHYLYIFIWPFNLSFDYEAKLATSVFSSDVIFPFAVLLGGFYGMYQLCKRDKAHPINFGLAWFFIAMLPRTSIFPSTELICDYKTYVASPGIFFIFSIALIWLALYVVSTASPLGELSRRPQAFETAIVALVLLLGGMTYCRNQVWSSELAFWKDVIEKSPNKARGYNNYAVALMEMGKVDEAIKQFENAVMRDAWYAEPHINLATIWHSRGQRDRAMTHYQRAFEIGEGHPELFHNLGLFHLEDKALDKAFACFSKAIELRPYYSRALCQLGKLYQAQGKLNEANACFERALKGDTPDQEVCLLYGMTCQEMGKNDQAIAAFKNIEQRLPQATFLLGCCYYNKRDYTTACSYLDKAYMAQPNDNVLAYNYALALMHAGRYEPALGLFAKCSQHGDLPFAQLHGVKCLYEVGRKDEAAKTLHTIINNTPHNEVKRDALALKKELKLD